MAKKFTQEEIIKHQDNIINDIAVNGMSLRRTLKQVGYPDVTKVYEWLKEDEIFAKRYARACEGRSEKIADEILEICDSTENDIITDSDGNQITNHNVIQRDKLRVDTRKWLLAKLHPKKYGDKLDVTTDGDKINTTPIINVIAPKE